MDKTLILNRIKIYLKLKNDKDLADFLGIKPNVLSNWYTRNSIDYDIVFTKCDFIDKNWLITGNDNTYINENKINECIECPQCAVKDKLIATFEQFTAMQSKYIEALESKDTLKFDARGDDASVAAAG